MKNTIKFILLFMFVFMGLQAQKVMPFKENFDKQDTQIRITGRGICKIENGVLKTKDAYASFGEHNWANYEIRFSARTPENEKKVQIWAGFRAYNRDDRYIIGLKGGIQNDLYLGRQGYMGTDEFLGLRALHFHPEPGQWYNFRIQVCDNRIRVFLNDEKSPRIDVIDKNSQLAPSGEITLGGSWIENEFDNLSITPLSEKQLKNVANDEYTVVMSNNDKEKKRIQERAAYKPVIINHLADSRTEISLDGQWLFMPEYELANQDKAISPSVSDNDWHSMTVPGFWNPIRIWLHGETFGPHAKGVSDNYFQQETARCENYTFDYKKTGAAWYRQWVVLPANIKGKNIELAFDAVSKVAEVWINGTNAGSHIGMFGDFKIDGTKLFKPGKNLVVVKVVRDYVKDIADADKVVDVAVTVPVTNKMLKDLAHGFYGGDPAGIWQPVKMVITDPVKITDVFIKPNLTGAEFEITIKNNSNVKKTFSFATTIIDKNTQVPLYNGTLLEKVEVNAGDEKKITCSIKDLKPKLWTPEVPNLYDFIFKLTSDNKNLDDLKICSGFRTFESKNGYLWLNGKRYWLRGADQTPFALAPNSVELADRFYQLMKAGNIEVTRTHTSPYNELWMDAADRNGIGISFEGTWPWLMINSSMPDMKLIDLWADEFLGLLKKYRNHPSLLMWTVNNEMKFYDNEPDLDKAKLKMKIISDVVKKIRTIDPTRPVCFDSNYKRNEKKFGKDFFKDIDDGDVDDIHLYPNWYDYTLFRQFNGEFQKKNHNEGRPLISQEMSTGYPNNETGHPTRFYTIVHQNPQSLVGDLAYEYSDPANFLEVQSFITGELAEALRRSNDQASGILHFSLVTWFRNVYDPQLIEPYPTYYAMKRALQPVLVSAELWGRHFYAGEKLPTRICVVNDKEDGSDLAPSNLLWQLVSSDGVVIFSGNCSVPEVKHYTREWISPNIVIPANLPADKTDAKLVLKLIQDNQVVSENEYKVLIAKKEWSQPLAINSKKVVLVDFNNMKNVFDYLNIHGTDVSTVSQALKTKGDLYIFSGLDQAKNCTTEDLKQIRLLIAQGGKVLLLNSENASKGMYPEYIKDWIVPTEGDIVNMEIPESPIFNGIDPLELRYFNNNQREVPTVCHVALKINRCPQVEALAEQIKIHGYINGSMEQRTKYMEDIKGFPIVKIKDNGTLTISTMSLEKAITDPIAGKLLSNLVDDLLK
ncbi:MAG: glycoside hydrolase family 2 TIM barrel-domain containing protein [Bacteroidota bacterium]|nr:glycoside hydrolase family 2 TIM barrel-domain containing protein [Bacteroidota bacterium]